MLTGVHLLLPSNSGSDAGIAACAVTSSHSYHFLLLHKCFVSRHSAASRLAAVHSLAFTFLSVTEKYANLELALVSNEPDAEGAVRACLPSIPAEQVRRARQILTGPKPLQIWSFQALPLQSR